MLINTGGRCDTVNYFSNWLIKRFEEGFVYSRNPYVPGLVHKYILHPDIVDCVIFCSKNYEPILDRLHLISNKFNIFCHYTITGYGKDIEPSVPDIDKSIETLIVLSKITGKQKLAWRYDPVLLTEKYTVDVHLDTFNYMAEKISPHVSFCIFSFVDMYKKLETNMPEIIPLSAEDKIKIVHGFGKIGQKYGLKIQTCAENEDYRTYGINLSGCTTSEILAKASNITFKKIPHKGMRAHCKCMQSRDIGAYDACTNGCRYCYANKSPEIAIKNMKNHNPNSPILIGEIKESDIIKEANKESFLIKKASPKTPYDTVIQGRLF